MVIEPTTSAVLKLHHIQLDHPCNVDALNYLTDCIPYHFMVNQRNALSLLCNLVILYKIKLYRKGKLNPQPQPGEGRDITN